MAYTPSTWVKGETISSARMNNIEDGISQVETRVDNIQNAISELEAGSLSAVGAAAGTVPVADGNGTWEWAADPVAEEVADLKSALTDVQRSVTDHDNLLADAFVNSDRIQGELSAFKDETKEKNATNDEELQSLNDHMAMKAEVNELADIYMETDLLARDVKKKADSNEVANLGNMVASIALDVDRKVDKETLENHAATLSNEIGAAMVEINMLQTVSNKNVDAISGVQAAIADVRSELDEKIPKPRDSSSGTAGQVLCADGTGGTSWGDPAKPTDQQIENAVNDWLDDHPEATTTVEDGSITYPKLDHQVQTMIESCADSGEEEIEIMLLDKSVEKASPTDEQAEYSAYATHIEEFCSKYLSGNGIGFVFYSDPHCVEPLRYGLTETEMQAQFQALKSCWENSPAEYVLCGGDWLNMGHTVREAATLAGRVRKQMRARVCAESYTVIGNHDMNSEMPVDRAFTHEEAARIWFGREHGYYIIERPNIDCYMFDSGTGFEAGDSTYNMSQIEWFSEKLLANKKEHLFGVIHLAKDSEIYRQPCLNITLLAKAFNSRTSETINGISYDFSQAKGTFHFLLTGHIHMDFVETLNTIPLVYIARMSMNNEIKFDFCYANFSNSVLHMVRVGDGESRTISII